VALHLEQVVAGFSRYHKYTLGTELRQASRAVVMAIAAANSARDKTSGLLALRARLDELLLLMRLAKEAKAFRSFASYAHAVEQVASVCRQNEGWLKSVTADAAGEMKGARIPPPRARARRAGSVPS
jgi:hypothetical protein